MKINKPNFWKSKNLISVLLFPFSFIVIMVTFFKTRLIKPTKFKIPIICVGNIYLGGTGKTPLSIFLAKEFEKRGKNPVIVRKYYKNHYDEHLLTKDKFKNFILNESRVDGIYDAINKKFDLAILDDGFQDQKIYKKINILCFNQIQKIGNGMVIPSGPLRESFKTVKNAQIVIINGKQDLDFEKQLTEINKKISIFYSKYIPLNINHLKNKNLFAVAGIGNPENFFDLLLRNDLNISKKFIFPDHYEFNKSEILDILKQAKENNCKIVVTEKDYYRIKKYNFDGIEHLRLKLEIENKDQLVNEILKNLNENS
tara:strand:+ start:1569 stop:2507 length:939 start_codon:yes stop_codon:yes gene_type:complete